MHEQVRNGKLPVRKLRERLAASQVTEEQFVEQHDHQHAPARPPARTTSTNDQHDQHERHHAVAILRREGVRVADDESESFLVAYSSSPIGSDRPGNDKGGFGGSDFTVTGPIKTAGIGAQRVLRRACPAPPTTDSPTIRRPKQRQRATDATSQRAPLPG